MYQEWAIRGEVGGGSTQGRRTSSDFIVEFVTPRVQFPPEEVRGYGVLIPSGSSECAVNPPCVSLKETRRDSTTISLPQTLASATLCFSTSNNIGDIEPPLRN